MSWPSWPKAPKRGIARVAAAVLLRFADSQSIAVAPEASDEESAMHRNT